MFSSNTIKGIIQNEGQIDGGDNHSIILNENVKQNQTGDIKSDRAHNTNIDVSINNHQHHHHSNISNNNNMMMGQGRSSNMDFTETEDDDDIDDRYITLSKLF